MRTFSDADLARLAEQLAERLAPAVLDQLKAAFAADTDGLCEQAEALAILNVSRSTLYRLVGAGVVTRRKLGVRNRFDRAELRAFVEKMRRGEVDLSERGGES